ncbi:hypothetical protein Bca4012_009901 [Brassica carinata]
MASLIRRNLRRAPPSPSPNGSDGLPLQEDLPTLRLSAIFHFLGGCSTILVEPCSADMPWLARSGYFTMYGAHLKLCHLLFHLPSILLEFAIGVA